MERWKNSVAVVTGASSGIGVAVTKDLLNSGITVIGLARRFELLQKLRLALPVDQQENFYTIQCDVSKTDAVQEAFDKILKKFDGIDILINNAGCTRLGQLSTMDISKVEDVVQTNIMGVIHCTQHAFKSMLDRKVNGHVILINSIFGHNVAALPGPLPMLNVYPATKFAVTAINEIYRQEFKALGTKVKVTSISPGLVDTEFISEQDKRVCGEAILKAQDIAQGVMFALATPSHVQIHEMTIKPMGEIV